MVSGKVKRDYPSNKTRFEDVYSNILSTSNSISVISNYYSYGLINYLQSESKSYNLLSDKNSAYWINSLVIDSENNCAWWAIRILRDDNFRGEILWDSNDGIGNSTAGVRSIVSLKSNVKLVGNGTTGYTLQVN